MLIDDCDDDAQQPTTGSLTLLFCTPQMRYFKPVLLRMKALRAYIYTGCITIAAGAFMDPVAV